MSELLFKDETYRMLGACFEVYKDKGCGFHEPVFHECLEIEFSMQGIPAISKPKVALAYKGRSLKQTFEPDFVCFQQIILELKAVSNLSTEHEAQVMNYLKATGFPLGMLVNFGHYPRLEHMRIVAHDKWHLQSAVSPDLHA